MNIIFTNIYWIRRVSQTHMHNGNLYIDMFGETSFASYRQRPWVKQPCFGMQNVCIKNTQAVWAHVIFNKYFNGMFAHTSRRMFARK